MPLYDWKCPLGHVTEARSGMSVRLLPCPECGYPAARQFTITDPGRIRITEGFRQVTASMVCAQKGVDWHPKSFKIPKPDGQFHPQVKLPWAGTFGHTKKVGDGR